MDIDGSSDNVYGRYLHASYVRTQWLPWTVLGLVLLIVAIFTVHAAMNAEYYSSGEYRSGTLTTPRKKLLDVIAVPGLIICFPIVSLVCLYLLAPLTRWGCEAFSFAWPRFYRRMCDRDSREKFKNARETYFNSMERYSSEVRLGERSMTVSGREGGSRDVAYGDVVQAFRGDGLMIFHTGSAYLPEDEVIIDLRPLSRRKRRYICKFIDGRLPVGCKTYYFRRKKGSQDVVGA